LQAIPQIDRQLHCLDPLACRNDIPQTAVFYQQSIIGNTLSRHAYDAVLVLSVLEHIGLPCYGLAPFPNGSERVLAECWSLLKPGGRVIVTVPAGQPKVTSWYRQYSPKMLERLFAGWRYEIRYWGANDRGFAPIQGSEVEEYDYRDRFDGTGRAGAVAGIVAYRS
jgi:SAM-dependent methyltransferase